MKTILIFDQAESPGGSISRAVDLAENMIDFKFIFITFYSLKSLKASTHKSHILSYCIKSFYNDRIALKHTTWLKNKCGWKFYHFLVTAFVSLLMGINRKITLWQALRILSPHKIDLIQANCGLHSLPYNLARKLDIPLIYYFRDLQNYQSMSPDRINIAERYIFVGSMLMNMYQRQLHLLQHKCIMIHSPFDVYTRIKFETTENMELLKKLKENGRKIIVCCSRICAEKGQHIIIAAIKQLVTSWPELTLLVVGEAANTLSDQNYLKSLKQTITEHQLNDSVIFLGHRNDPLHILQYAEIAVQAPTYFEALAGSIVESVQLGIPTISSDIGGAREVLIEGETGFLFPPEDYNSLAKIIDRILRNPVETAQIAEQGKAYALQNWSPVKISTQMRAIYTSTKDAL